MLAVLMIAYERREANAYVSRMIRFQGARTREAAEREASR
jgi:hypothetical protein